MKSAKSTAAQVGALLLQRASDFSSAPALPRMYQINENAEGIIILFANSVHAFSGRENERTMGEENLTGKLFMPDWNNDLFESRKRVTQNIIYVLFNDWN